MFQTKISKLFVLVSSSILLASCNRPSISATTSSPITTAPTSAPTSQKPTSSSNTSGTIPTTAPTSPSTTPAPATYEITVTGPTKTSYFAGEAFSSEGLVVTLFTTQAGKKDEGVALTKEQYQLALPDGSALTDGTILGEKLLKDNKVTSLSISVKENQHQRTASFALTLNPVAKSLEISAAPTKKTFLVGEKLDLAGLKVFTLTTKGKDVLEAETTDYKVYLSDGKTEATNHVFTAEEASNPVVFVVKANDASFGQTSFTVHVSEGYTIGLKAEDLNINVLVDGKETALSDSLKFAQSYEDAPSTITFIASFKTASDSEIKAADFSFTNDYDSPITDLSVTADATHSDASKGKYAFTFNMPNRNIVLVYNNSSKYIGRDFVGKYIGYEGYYSTESISLEVKSNGTVILNGNTTLTYTADDAKDPNAIQISDTDSGYYTASYNNDFFLLKQNDTVQNIPNYYLFAKVKDNVTPTRTKILSYEDYSDNHILFSSYTYGDKTSYVYADFDNNDLHGNVTATASDGSAITESTTIYKLTDTSKKFQFKNNSTIYLAPEGTNFSIETLGAEQGSYTLSGDKTPFVLDGFGHVTHGSDEGTYVYDAANKLLTVTFEKTSTIYDIDVTQKTLSAHVATDPFTTKTSYTSTDDGYTRVTFENGKVTLRETDFYNAPDPVPYQISGTILSFTIPVYQFEGASTSVDTLFTFDISQKDSKVILNNDVDKPVGGNWLSKGLEFSKD